MSRPDTYALAKLRPVPAQREGECPYCKGEPDGGPIHKGDLIRKVAGRWVHNICAAKAERALLSDITSWLKYERELDTEFDVEGLRNRFMESVTYEGEDYDECWTFAGLLWLGWSETDAVELAWFLTTSGWHKTKRSEIDPVATEFGDLPRMRPAHHCLNGGCIRPTHLYLEAIDDEEAKAA